MRKNVQFFLLQICCLLMACAPQAQVQNNVVRIHAFKMPVPAYDDEGRESPTGLTYHHHLFAETTGKYLPNWNVVYTNHGVFAVRPEEITSGNTNVGVAADEKPQTISVKRGNRLWRLELVPMKARIPAEIAELLTKNEVVLITEWENRQYTHTVATTTTLKSAAK